MVYEFKDWNKDQDWRYRDHGARKKNIFSPIEFKQGKILFKLRVEEAGMQGDNALVEKWVVMEKDFIKLAGMLIHKYSLAKYQKEKKEDKDLDWAK